MSQVSSRKHKLAVIGGGISSMTAVFQITSQPGWEKLYDITVYQSGFRLGGKGASGRNRQHHDRIEEHGLHIFMGFYENTFRILRACYEELDRPPGAPLRTWEEAFAPHDHIVLFEQIRGQWKAWPLPFPQSAGTPGDGTLLPPMWCYIPMILQAMLRVLSAFELESSNGARILNRFVGVAREHLAELIDGVMGADSMRGSVMLRALRATEPARPLSDRAPVKLFAGVVKALRKLLSQLELDGGPVMRRRAFDALVPVVDALRQEVWEEIGREAEVDDHARRTWILIDLMATNVRGMIRENLVFPPFPFEEADGLDYKAWLRIHGADERTVESAPVNAIYDLVFSRAQGICAGSAIRGSLRMMLTYKGSIFYKMQAGMGDVVFAPLYEVLKRRGVKFQFFHRLDNVRLSRDKSYAAALEFGRQATVKDGGQYEPLYHVKGLPCWPSEPLWEQLVEGERFRREGVDLENFFDKSHDVEKVELEVGRDFDSVVLGVSIGALPFVAREVIENAPKLKGAVDNIRTTATQAVQLWLKPDLKELGWSEPSPVTTAYAKPFDTWADMSHLLPRESFEHGEVGNIAYLCGGLADPSLPPSVTDPHPIASRETRRHAGEWLDQNAAFLWPQAARGCGLDHNKLFDAKGREGEDRLEGQYIRCSVNPSDRYVLSVPGSTKFRPRTEETNLRNLLVTGDWITTGIQGGCAEGAVMAGLQTARAICGSPQHIFGDYTPPLPAPLARPLLPDMEGQTPYIERGGDIVLRAPYAQNNTRLYGFVLPADAERLTALCDKYLNIGKTKYRPLGPFVVLGCADIQEIRSLYPDDVGKGYMPERDVAFWVPVLGECTDPDSPVAEHLAWFLPYIFVDSAPPMAVGREVYGFPKLAGRIEFGEPEGRANFISVDAIAIARYARDSRAEEHRILEVRRKADVDYGPLSLLWSAFDKAVTGMWSGAHEAVQQVAVDSALAALNAVASRASTSQPVRMVFLKQFRDVGDPRRACYQAIVSANAKTTAYRGGGPLDGPFEIQITRLESHPIVADLGLAGERMEALFAAWVDFDFDVDVGETMP